MSLIVGDPKTEMCLSVDIYWCFWVGVSINGSEVYIIKYYMLYRNGQKLAEKIFMLSYVCICMYVALICMYTQNNTK